MEIVTSLVEHSNNTTQNEKTNEASKKTSNTFNELLTEPIEDKETKSEKRERLLADITSLFKTGFTVDELKALQDMIAKIKERMNEEDLDQSEINSMLDDLEKAISQFQKEINGITVIDSEDLENTSSDTSSIAVRLDKAQENINTMIKTDDLSKYTQSEILEEILNFKEA